MPTGQVAAVSQRRVRAGRFGTKSNLPEQKNLNKMLAPVFGPGERRVIDVMMLSRRLHDIGLRDWQMQSLSFGSIGLCIALWIRAKTVD
jgi:hypothetical protein